MACELDLSGLEFACPRFCGRRMLHEPQALTTAASLTCSNPLADGTFATLDASELDLGYRHSKIADEGMIVLSATFDLHRADGEDP